ncbi:UNVERIFIED_ORG: hypothetical protein E4P37_14610 [Bacillus sp. AZ43]
MRNGLAIAGMAGGMLFLGQAVASADVENNNDVNQGAEANGGSGAGSGAGAGNYSNIENDTEIDVENDAEGGNSNTGNKVVVTNNTGNNDPGIAAGSKEGDVHVELVIDSSATNNLDVDSGSIKNSSNGSIDGDAASGPDVVNNNDVDQYAEANGGDKGKFPFGNDAESGNESEIENDTEIDLENDAEGGNSNTGNVVIVENNTGDNDPELYCYSKEGDVYCSITIDSSVTNNINVDSGDICGSSNASIGGAAYHCDEYGHPHADHHRDHKAAAPAAHTKKAAPTYHRAPMNTSAQPKGQLAYTGAETTAPLTLGLLALGAGGALTLAGRRKTSTQAV